MAKPILTPLSTVSSIVLPSSGDISRVGPSLPFGIYGRDDSPLYSSDFISGALDQVAFTYYKLGGNILDIELMEENIYAIYEEACLEYSYHVNLHQAKNVLSDALGSATATFDHDGHVTDGSAGDVQLKYPKFSFSYARRVFNAIGVEIGVGGDITEHKVAFDLIPEQQDYDLQEIVSNHPDFANIVGSKRIRVSKVYYKTPRAGWRFYGYFGGLTAVGNLHGYGQWADDTTFEMIPTWQNKLQAMAYEDAIYTRLSHFSYEIKNNKLKLFPTPSPMDPARMWINFYIPQDIWQEEEFDNGLNGVNNMNTLPFSNIPYNSINGPGKQWIRDYAFALAMEVLGNVRSKFSTVPIPGESVTLNGPELITRAKAEQDRLREELKTILDELTYTKMLESDASKMESFEKMIQKIPMTIYVG